MIHLTKRARELFQLDKSQLIDMIISYEGKCKDMELEDIIEKYPGKSKYYYDRTEDYRKMDSSPTDISELDKADAAMKRFSAKLLKESRDRGKNGKHKVIKGKGKKTSKSCKRRT